MTPRIAPLLLLGLLAGCTSDPGPADVAVPEAPRVLEPPAPIVDESPFGWAVAVGNPAGGGQVQVATTNAAHAEVEEGTAHMLVETSWTCVSPTCTLRIRLMAPGDVDLVAALTGQGAFADATGTGNVTLEVEEPMPGRWTVVAESVGATAGVDGTFRVTLSAAPEPEPLPAA